MSAWRFIELRGIDLRRLPCMREALAISVGKELVPNTLIISQGSGEYIQISRNSNIAKMVNLEFCRKNGIALGRSMSLARSGGFYDENSFKCLGIVSENTQLPKELFYESIVSSLRSLGIPAEHTVKTNNILIRGKKVSTGNYFRQGKSFIFHMTLNLDFNYDRAEKAFISPKNMREWVTSLKKETDREISFDELRDSVKQAFQQTLGVTFEDGELTLEEEREVKELLQGKYSSESWMKYGKWSPVKEYWRPK